jgi:hypothetical protein
MCFHFFESIQYFFSNGFLEGDVEPVGLLVIEVIVQYDILTDAFSTQVFFVHIVEDAPFGVFCPFVDRGDESRRSPSILTATSVFVSRLEAPCESSLPAGISEGILGLHIVQIGLLILFLLVEESAYQISLEFVHPIIIDLLKRTEKKARSRGKFYEIDHLMVKGRFPSWDEWRMYFFVLAPRYDVLLGPALALDLVPP